MNPRGSSIAASRAGGDDAPATMRIPVDKPIVRLAVARRVEDEHILVPIHELRHASERKCERLGRPGASAFLSPSSFASTMVRPEASKRLARTRPASRASRLNTGSPSRATTTT